MRIEPYPYPARAWLGEAVVARSESCLCLEREGEPSVLCFPESDIDFEPFSAEDHDRPRSEADAARLWSAPGLRDVLCTFTEPAPGLEKLRGHGAFDQERVRLEVFDGAPGDEPRDVTLKAFPTWGDASHLLDMLDLRPDGEHGFVSVVHSDGRRPVVEGSQMLGQAIVAACRLAPARRVVSASMAFLRAADARVPLRFELEPLSAGRVFTAYRAQVLQDRCCAEGTLLLHAPASEIIGHAVEPPIVSGPYESPPCDMGVTGRDLRVVDGAYTNDPDAPTGPPTLDCWVRFRQVPDDPALHAGLLAQFTGHMPIAAALRPHPGIGQAQAHRTVSMGISAISLSLHREPRADAWMLYHHLSTFAGGGMTHAECRVHDQAGALVASFAVEAMVQPFPSGTASVDERTAL